MKVKNVIKGLMNEYDLEEINVISDEKVIYSGTIDGWKTTSVNMVLYKREVENMDVVNRMVFNNRKAFIFVGLIHFGELPIYDDLEPITHLFQD